MATAAVAPRDLDDIRVFLGNIPDDEYAMRARLRSARNAASYRATKVQSPDARQLLWMCTEAATAWVYDGTATVTELKNFSEYCRRLIVVAEHAEAIYNGE